MQRSAKVAANGFEKVLLSSRLIVYLAVAGSLLASLTCMVVGVIVAVGVAHGVVFPAEIAEDSKHIAIDLVEVIDLFLLGTVMYIVATGLYSIFINPKITQLSWMEVHTLDALKAKIIGVVIVLLAVTFLGNVVQWKGGTDILAFGGAIGLVLGALAVLLNFGGGRPDDHPLK